MNPSDYDLLQRLARGEPLPSPERDAELTTFGRSVVQRCREANGHTDDVTLTLALQQLLSPADAEETLRTVFAHEPPPSLKLPSSARFRALSLAELRMRPRPTYLVDRLLQADTVAALEGVDGTYKTFLALAWVHCIALGMPWLGRPVQEGRVLYLLGEGTRGLPQRADAWQMVNLHQRHDLTDLVGFVVDEMPQLWKGDAQHVLAANPGPYSLVVVDTLARAMVGGNENMQQDMGLLVDGCDQLRRGYGGACVLILHHLNLQGGSRGSTALPGALNTRLRLKREGAAPIVTLSVEKQKDDEPDHPITLVARKVELGGLDDRCRPLTSLVLEIGESTSSWSERLGGPEGISGPRLTPGETKALQTLSSIGEATFAAWRDASELPHSTWKDARSNLKKHGLVEQLARGQYRVTPLGEQEGRKGPEQGRFVLSSIGNGERPEMGGESLKDSAFRPSGPALGGVPGKDLPW